MPSTIKSISCFSITDFRICEKSPSSIITSGLIPEKAASNDCRCASASAIAALSRMGQLAGWVMGLITGGLTCKVCNLAPKRRANSAAYGIAASPAAEKSVGKSTFLISTRVRFSRTFMVHLLDLTCYPAPTSSGCDGCHIRWCPRSLCASLS